MGGIEDPVEARNNAFGAMGMFLFTFLASLGAIWYDAQRKPQGSAGGENGEMMEGTEYHLSTEKMATYGTTT